MREHSTTVAIVHDYLNQPGGAERVVLELARIWPQAPIYTSIYRPGPPSPSSREHENPAIAARPHSR